MAKISFDYDGVLSTAKGKKLAKEKISEGDQVYIITARQQENSESVYSTAKDLGINRDKVHFTNGQDKWKTIKRLNITVHYDNNPEQIDKINELTDCLGILYNH